MILQSRAIEMRQEMGVQKLLHDFTIGQQREIQLNKPHRDIYETALTILSRYGDSLEVDSARNLE